MCLAPSHPLHLRSEPSIVPLVTSYLKKVASKMMQSLRASVCAITMDMNSLEIHADSRSALHSSGVAANKQ